MAASLDTTPSRSRRGPYRIKKRTPRQTRFYRAHKISLSLHNTTDHDCNDVNVGTDGDHDHDNGPTTDTSSINNQNESQGDHNEAVTQADEPNIYSGSLLSSTTSNLTICSFICRHQLSKQAQEDLLQLIGLHVPVDTEFPTTLYKFRKNCNVDYTAASVEQMIHYYCPLCHAPVANKQIQTCPNVRCSIRLH